jgi:predicted DNA-binding antitoxin AbrB/MazE fold protein
VLAKRVLPKMQRTIAVVYEKGVFKPLEKVELREDLKAKVTIEKEKGIITLEDIKELEESIKTLRKSKISLKRIEEICYEGKMLD